METATVSPPESVIGTTGGKAKSSAPRTFEEYLLEEKLATSKDLLQARQEQAKIKGTLEEALISLNLFDEEKLTRARAGFFASLTWICEISLCRRRRCLWFRRRRSKIILSCRSPKPAACSK